MSYVQSSLQCLDMTGTQYTSRDSEKYLNVLRNVRKEFPHGNTRFDRRMDQGTNSEFHSSTLLYFQIKRPGNTGNGWTCMWVSLCNCVQFCNSTDCNLLASLSMGFPSQEYYSGLPFLSPGIKPVSLVSPALEGKFLTTSTTWETWLITKTLSTVWFLLKADSYLCMAKPIQYCKVINLQLK